MVKLLLALLIFLFFSLNSNAQTLSGVVEYNESIITDTIKIFGSTNEGTLFFDVGQNKSVYVTDRNLNPEPDKHIFEKKDDGTTVAKKTNKNGSKIGKILYKNYFEKKLIFRDGFMGKAFIVNDAYPEINWQILDSSKSIKDLVCQKAEGEFRGRHYTAWFTNKIPVPDGPWKLCGLPGLILEAYDEKKHFIFSVVSVEFPKKIEEPLISPTQGEDIDFKLFYKQKLKATEDARKKLQSINEAHNIKSFEERFSFNFLERNIKD